MAMVSRAVLVAGIHESFKELHTKFMQQLTYVAAHLCTKMSNKLSVSAADSVVDCVLQAMREVTQHETAGFEFKKLLGDDMLRRICGTHCEVIWTPISNHMIAKLVAGVFCVDDESERKLTELYFLSQAEWGRCSSVVTDSADYKAMKLTHCTALKELFDRTNAQVKSDIYSCVLIIRVSVLLARWHLPSPNDLLHPVTTQPAAETDHSKAAGYISKALEHVRLLAKLTDESTNLTPAAAAEVVSVLSADSRLLHHMMTVHGRLQHPAKLLEYLEKVYSKVKPVRVCQELHTLCVSLRLQSLISLAWCGLGSSSTDREVLRRNIASTAVVSSDASLWQSELECFALSCVQLLNQSELFFGKLANECKLPQYFAQDEHGKYVNCSDGAQFVQEVADLVAVLDAEKSAMGRVVYDYFRAWTALLAAKVLLLAFHCPVEANTSAKTSFSVSLKRHELELVLPRLECLLFIAELQDLAGKPEVCAQYISEAHCLSESFGAKALQNTVSLHVVRLWHRMRSSRLTSTLGELLDKDEYLVRMLSHSGRKDDLSEYDEVPKRCVATVSCLTYIFGLPLSQTELHSKDVDAVSLHYKYAKLHWDGLDGSEAMRNNDVVALRDQLSSDGICLYHSFMSIDVRQLLARLREETSSKANQSASEHGGSFLLCKRAAPGSDTIPNICAQLPPRFINFDVLRDVRRNTCLSWIRQGTDTSKDSVALRAFLSGAASCSVSLDCHLDAKESEAFHKDKKRSAQLLNKFLFSGDTARREMNTLEKTIRTRLNAFLSTDFFSQRGTKSKSDSERGALCNAVCFMALDAFSDNVLIGRADKHGELTVALPIKRELQEMLKKWQELIDSRLTPHLGLLKGLNERDDQDATKKADFKEWHSTYKQIDEAMDEYLREMETLLGPWSVLLCGNQVGDRVQQLVGWDAMAQQLDAEIRAMSLAPNCLLKPELSGDFDFDAEPVLTSKTVSAAKVACGSWTTFLQSCVVSGRLSEEEARSAVEAVVRDWDALLSEQQTRNVASELMKAGVPDVAADQKSPADTTSSAQATRQTRSKANAPSSAATARTKAESSKHTADSDVVCHTVFILDETVQSFPWESLPCLRGHSTSRMPHIAFLLDSFATSGAVHGAARGAAGCSDDDSGGVVVSASRGWCALDIHGDRPTKQTVVRPFLKPYAEHYDWKTVVGEIPPRGVLQTNHQQSDLFIYCGHNAGEAMCHSSLIRKLPHCPAALLWGCSSGRLSRAGVHDPYGIALSYLLAGAPFVLGYLWNVVTTDNDKITIKCISGCVPNPVDISATVSNKFQAKAETLNISQALSKARSAGIHTHTTGSASVVYGVPVMISQ